MARSSLIRSLAVAIAVLAAGCTNASTAKEAEDRALTAAADAMVSEFSGRTSSARDWIPASCFDVLTSADDLPSALAITIMEADFSTFDDEDFAEFFALDLGDVSTTEVLADLRGFEADSGTAPLWAVQAYLASGFVSGEVSAVDSTTNLVSISLSPTLGSAAAADEQVIIEVPFVQDDSGATWRVDACADLG